MPIVLLRNEQSWLRLQGKQRTNKLGLFGGNLCTVRGLPYGTLGKYQREYKERTKIETYQLKYQMHAYKGWHFNQQNVRIENLSKRDKTS